MAKLTKNNSFSSILAIVIAVVALFAGVYAVMKVNANPNSSAAESTTDLKCRYACGNGVEVCRKDCVRVISTGSSCQTLGGTDTTRINKCLNAVAKLPSTQCANFCLAYTRNYELTVRVTPTGSRLGGMDACVNSCAEIESGSKSCQEVCGVIPNSTDTGKKARNACVSECGNIVPN